MRSKLNELIGIDPATIFIFLYGVIIQIVSLPIIYYFSVLYHEYSASMYETLFIIWYCIPAAAVFSIILAAIQIKQGKNSDGKSKMPLVGLTLNGIWFFSYLFVLYMIFVVKTPFMLTQ